jgi:hypothetical protein
LVTEGVETNPGRKGEEDKTVQILSYVKNKEKEVKPYRSPWKATIKKSAI